MAPHNETAVLLDNLRRAFGLRSWHGPNLIGSIRGLTPEEGAWRPQPERHNIWEYVVHAAYWKYRVVKLLEPDFPGSFDLAGSNFFERPLETSKSALKRDIKLLNEWHERLLAAVETLDAAVLSEVRGEFDVRAVILGAAAHDVYHAGQIRLIRRMWEAAV